MKILDKLQSPVSLNSCHKPRTMTLNVSLNTFFTRTNLSSCGNSVYWSLTHTTFWESMFLECCVICSNLARRRGCYISQTYKLLAAEMCAEMLCHTIYTLAVVLQMACEKHTAWRVNRPECVKDQWRANTWIKQDQLLSSGSRVARFQCRRLAYGSVNKLHRILKVHITFL
jgi:hypothetical protein